MCAGGVGNVVGGFVRVGFVSYCQGMRLRRHVWVALHLLWVCLIVRAYGLRGHVGCEVCECIACVLDVNVCMCGAIACVL